MGAEIDKHGPNPPMIVGIDGSIHGVRALEWAAEVAAARRWPIRLVHAHEPYAPQLARAPLYEAVDPAIASEALLEDVRARLNGRLRDVSIELVSTVGKPVDVLLDELRGGRMLVLGRRGIGRFAALILGSTTMATIIRANGPVVVIPPDEGQSNSGRSAKSGRIVVGIDGSEYGQSAIRFAFDEASQRGASLEVLHAWDLPSPFGYDYASFGGREAWVADRERNVAEIVAGWRERYPDVDVTITLEEDHAAAALTRRAGTADLLVVGGRGGPSGALVANLVGSTARAVVHHAGCPVAVVPLADQDR
jgi:nucleotide-binding universal stress UspA family protein